MPLEIKPDGQLVLKCINHGSAVSHTATGQETTMIRMDQQWYVLTLILPPKDGKPPNTQLGSGLPVGCYVCSVCGYVEMYAAAITAPDLWKVGK